MNGSTLLQRPCSHKHASMKPTLLFLAFALIAPVACDKAAAKEDTASMTIADFLRDDARFKTSDAAASQG